MSLVEAAERCKTVGAQVFTPKEAHEMIDLENLAKSDFELDWAKDFFWIGYRLKNPTFQSFPPELAGFRNEPLTDLLKPYNFGKFSKKNCYNKKYYEALLSQSIFLF